MSTPKRRKKNGHDSSPATTRSLDFYFSAASTTTKRQEIQPILRPTATATEDEAKSALTDEELALRLQKEWNEEIAAPSVPSVPADLIRHANDEAPSSLAAAEDLISTVSNEASSNLVAEEKKTAAESPGPIKPATLSLQSSAALLNTVTIKVPFDENPLIFDPSLYLPELRKEWKVHSGTASYGLLVRCFVLVNSTQSRIKIVDTLVNLLRTIIEGDPESLQPAVWLATNSISPPYISLELGLGGSAISKALKQVYGLDNPSLKALWEKHGDAGDVAFEAKKRQAFTLRKPKPLSIKGVYESLVKIANSTGTGSQEFKQRIVERLLHDAQGAEESRYIVRTLVQHLRIGAVKTTMLIALSRAFLLSRPPHAHFSIRSGAELLKLKKEELALVYGRGEELVKACFAQRPNYNDLVSCLLDGGLSEELLVRCGLSLHIPLRPMLGSITRDLGEMLTKLQGRDFSCEFKYDGQRAQLHCDTAGKVSIFSRHLEVMTDKYPDLVALVPKIRAEGAGSFILEGEVVAVDRETGDIKPFQTLTNRARKDVDLSAITVDVCLFAFDLMYLDGASLLNRPFRERRELLRGLFVEIPRRFTWVRSFDATSADSDAVLEFFQSATEAKCEGIMVKVLDNALNPDLPADDEIDTRATISAPPPTPSRKKKATSSKSTMEKSDEKDKGTRRKALLATYEPDKRLDSWLKVKKDYRTSADTLDLIPIAGWYGTGRKAKWWSPILLAVRNPDTGSLEAVTKCISGFTDKFYQANRERYAPGSANVIARPAYVDYQPGPAAGEPAVWFEPQEVWEMAFADVTLSPTYTAAIGLVSDARGLSLRFPRFLRARDDKSIEEASTAHFLAGLWQKQEARAVVEPGGGSGGVAAVAVAAAGDGDGDGDGGDGGDGGGGDDDDDDDDD